jgi:hypothetical protein
MGILFLYLKTARAVKPEGDDRNIFLYYLDPYASGGVTSMCPLVAIPPELKAVE